MNKDKALDLALEALEPDPNVSAWAVEKVRHKAIAAIKERLAQPEQEPCGWQFYQDGKWHNGMETSNHRANTEAAGIPVRNVYPSPPAAKREWVKLTTDEIGHEAKKSNHEVFFALGALWADAKLKEKNHD